MTLSCPAVGNPIPEITWYKNGVNLDAASRSRYEIISEGRQLRIKNAALEDTAIYTCEARNKAGRDKVDFDAEVLGMESLCLKVKPHHNLLTLIMFILLF